MDEPAERGAGQNMVETRNLSWDALADAVDQLGVDWLFRGQRDAKWDLVTSLERHTPPGLTRSDAEARLLADFRARAHNYVPPHQLPQGTGEWLALMQHFGAPTRLLDMTQSPYVAIYFAVEEAVEDAGKCAVWAVHRSLCIKRAGDVVLAVPGARTALENRLASGELQDFADFDLTLLAGWLATVAPADVWLTEHRRMIVPFVPKRLTERLSIQQGMFLVPRDVEASFMENLRTPPANQESVLPYAIKFVISNRERPRILEQLRLMNITRASLFPGLDGFAQSFRQTLIEESLEDKQSRVLKKRFFEVLSGMPSERMPALEMVSDPPPEER
jgi:hypothetical protein